MTRRMTLRRMKLPTRNQLIAQPLPRDSPNPDPTARLERLGLGPAAASTASKPRAWAVRGVVKLRRAAQLERVV